MLSWGFVEVIGYIPAIAAADAMVKAANVEFVGIEIIGGAMLTVAVQGDVGAVNAAVDAGAEAAKENGELHCALVLARPNTETAKMLKLKLGQEAI